MTRPEHITAAADAEADALLEAVERGHARLAVDVREAAALVWAAHPPGPPATTPEQAARGDVRVGVVCAAYSPDDVLARLRALPDGAGTRAFLVALGNLPDDPPLATTGGGGAAAGSAERWQRGRCSRRTASLARPRGSQRNRGVR